MASARRTASTGIVAEAAFLVGRRRAAQNGEVRDGTAPRPGAPPVNPARTSRSAIARSGSRRGIEERARDPIGQGRLADALRARRSARHGGGGRCAAPPGRPPHLPRGRRRRTALADAALLELVRARHVLIVTRHRAGPHRMLGQFAADAPAGLPRSRPRPRPGPGSASTTTHRFGLASAMDGRLDEGPGGRTIASPSNRSAASPLRPRAGSGPRKPDFGGKIEDEGQVGPFTPCDGHRSKRVDQSLDRYCPTTPW